MGLDLSSFESERKSHGRCQGKWKVHRERPSDRFFQILPLSPTIGQGCFPKKKKMVRCLLVVHWCLPAFADACNLALKQSLFDYRIRVDQSHEFHYNAKPQQAP